MHHAHGRVGQHVGGGGVVARRAEVLPRRERLGERAGEQRLCLGERRHEPELVGHAQREASDLRVGDVRRDDVVDDRRGEDLERLVA